MAATSVWPGAHPTLRPLLLLRSWSERGSLGAKALGWGIWEMAHLGVCPGWGDEDMEGVSGPDGAGSPLS